MKKLDHQLRKTTRLLMLLIAAISVLVGCGGGGSGGSLGGGGGTGTLAIHMVDAPLQGLVSMDVVISSVQANINGNWVTLATPNASFNLLDFQTHDVLLASKPLPAGDYTQIRLIVASASVTDASGTHDLKIPSGMQTGIKVDVDMPVQANVITDVLLDFNVAKSLHITGNGKYMFQPVVGATLKILSGTISGTVTSGGNPAAGAQVDAVYTSGPNFAAGTLVNSALTQADGTFKVWTLLPGTYQLNVTFTIPNTTTVQMAHVFGVVVVAAQDTPVGTIALFTPGSVSGTVTNLGNPVAGASVTATYTAGANLVVGTVVGPVTTAADGSFSIPGLAPGTYTVSATSGVMTGNAAGVVVTDGTNTVTGAIAIL